MNLLSTKVAYAAESFNDFLAHVNSYIITPLIELLFAVAVAYFLYGMVEFILSQSNEEKKTSGKGHMLWGVVGLTIMLGVYAILNIILNTLSLQGQIKPETNEVTLPDYNPPPAR